jgi:glutamine amidotransferase
MIAVVDVCSGNLRSVEKAIAHVGGDVQVTFDPDRILRADKVVVPGQGAFGAFVKGLAERGLEAPLREVLKRGTPMLGICLGLQCLFDDSEEQGPVRGLGLVGGHVVKFRGDGLKVPHIGWNQVVRVSDDPLLKGIPPEAYFYFVHSYYPAPSSRAVTVLETEYGPHRFCAAIRQDNLFACQFHPEKSQAVGLRLLENFVHA